MANLNAKALALLQRLIEATNSATGYIFGTKAEYKVLSDAGYAEFNEAVKDGNKVAVRASPAGVAAFNEQSGGQANGGTSQPAPAASTFKITKGLQMPAIKRRVGEATGSKYPFDGMEVGDSFHVPNTDDLPNAAKSLASSVTAANMRYATKGEGTHKTPKGNDRPNYVYSRVYQIRAVGKDDPDGAGARIWRTK